MRLENPPAAIEGLTSYKLSSNENPLPPIPAVLQAIADQTDINRYPDPPWPRSYGTLWPASWMFPLTMSSPRRELGGR